MKKLAAIFFTLLFASTASAQVISNPTTNARMGGLGVDNWQIEDGFNIFINPAQLSNYKNEVHAELGSWGSTDSVTTHPFGGVNNDRINPWGGMNIDASYGGWGVYLGRPYSTTGPLTAMGVTPPAANRFDLFYATHGMPLGFYLIRRVQPETFRRVCMSFDAYLVSFGLSRTVARLDVVPPVWAYQLMTITIIIDVLLLRTFFGRRAEQASPASSPSLEAA